MYNIYFEAAAAVYTAVLCLFLKIQYANHTKINREFFTLAVLVFVVDLLDVLTAVTITRGARIPPAANLMFNTFYYVMLGCLGYQFIAYIYAYVREKKDADKKYGIHTVMLALYLLLILGNLFFGYLFSFDAAGAYVRGSLYGLVFFVPVCFVPAAGVILCYYRHTFVRKQKITLWLFLGLELAGPVCQMLFFPDVLLSLFTVSVGLVILMFALETPDYMRLMQTMEYLKQARQETQALLEKEVQPKEPEPAGFLARLSFLDTKTGMAYCGDSEEFYREMLSSYLETDRYDDLWQCYNEKDWENYRIGVHALKSTSLSIGALRVSEQAKQLEQAAKDGDTAYIEAHHAAQMEDYGALLSDLRSALGDTVQTAQDAADISGECAHILVVDDDAMNLRIAEKMLKEQFSVSCAKSGQEAFAFLEENHADLILLDLNMPKMDGFEVIKRLKAGGRTREIPVIFLTADNDRESEVRGFLEGALDFITKPFLAEVMIQRVSRILELNQLQKNLQQEVQKQTRTAEARRKKVERLYRQIMETLAKTIDVKDKYTNGHSMRVAEYAKMLAARLGRSEKEQDEIYDMGLLHDIGKIGIPDDIINKPDKLTDEEYAVIKKHPVIGSDILKNIEELKDIGIGARWHHERYDGKGYPDGLAGTDIPQAARIIGIADAYDAMASRRAYRDVLPQKVVRAEIEKGKGTQFDPDFADAMLSIIDEDTGYRMREK